MGGSEARPHDYAISVDGQAVQVVPGLLSIRTLVMMNMMPMGSVSAGHAIIRGSSVSVSALVLHSASGVSSSHRSDNKSTMSSVSASEDIDIDITSG